MARAGFGTPKYGPQGGNFKKTGKPSPGDVVIRILPPMHSLAAEGKWKYYETTHWGWVGEGKEPGKTSPRPFRCIKEENRRTKMVTQPCPACDLYDMHDAQAKEEEAKLTAAGLVKDELETAMAEFKSWLKAHNIEGKYYVNVKYEDGTFGDFKLNHKWHMTRINDFTEGDPKTGKKSLLESDGIDPIADDQGVWFIIHRKDINATVPDTVDIKYENEVVNGRNMKSIKLAPLSDEDCATALKECRDLTTLGGQKLTFEQIKELVECSGDPEEVDRIMGPRESSSPASAGAPAPAPAATPAPAAKAPAPAVKPAAAPAPAAKPAPAPAATPASTMSPALAAAMAARKAQIEAKAKAEAEAKAKAEAEAAAAAAAAEPAVSAEDAEIADLLNMSEVDFMTKFGSGTPTA